MTDRVLPGITQNLDLNKFIGNLTIVSLFDWDKKELILSLYDEGGKFYEIHSPIPMKEDMERLK